MGNLGGDGERADWVLRQFTRVVSGLRYWPLDVAEKLPGQKDKHRSMRKWQDREALRALDSARAPDGTTLEFLGFHLMEVYQIESFQKLERDLLRLFTDDDAADNSHRITSSIRRSRETFRSIGWTMVGTIVRDKTHNVLPPPYCVMRGLPCEVDSIDVSLYMVTTSVAVVLYRVTVNATASSALHEVQSRVYRPFVQAKGNFSVGEGIWSYRFGSADAERQRAIVGWLEGLRAGVERCLARRTRGVFTGAYAHGSCLPAIEVYAVKGVCAGGRQIVDWKTQARGWAGVHGFDLWPSSFDGHCYIFNPSMDIDGSSDGKPSNVHVGRLLIMADQLLSDTDVKGPGDEAPVMWQRANDLLFELLPFQTYLALLDAVEARFLALRPDAFRAMGRGGRLSLSLRVQRRLRASLIEVERLQMDFKHLAKLYASQVDTVKMLSSRDEDLHTSFVSAIEWKTEALGAFLLSTMSWLDADVESRSIRATQWLTGAALSLAVVEVLMNLDHLPGVLQWARATFSVVGHFVAVVLGR